MAGRAKKAAAAPKKNGYKMPAPIPVGEVIHNTIAKKKWRIGPSIGVGGFGEIYSACEHENSPKKGSNYPLVVKIEPHENGPLFVEKHFYVRNASSEEISKYMKAKKLSSLGMPSYYGNGSHEYKGEKYRYLVLERYGKDVWSIFKESGRSFPPATVFLLGLQMLEVLEYIHSRGYVHADIKGANILMGLRKGTENQAYLVDFGLATRVNEKDFKPDPKSAHNGTIEYTSRDAHQGVATMRGDLEILGYNMLQWLVGELPWEKSLKVPKTVQDMKEAFLKNVRSNITKQYSNVPDALIKFFEYINTMKPKDVPDYTKCRQLFEGYLKSEGKNRSSKLDFSPNKKGKTNKKLLDDEDATDSDVGKKKKANGVAPKVVKRGRKPKAKEISKDTESDEDASEDADSAEEEVVPKKGKQNGSSPKVVRRGRKPKAKESSPEIENEEPNESTDAKVVSKKRKSLEPVLLVKMKKAKLAPKATPPAKKNHANIATQTSGGKCRRSPRQVSFDSPICEIIGEKKPLKISKDDESVNSSGDIFDDSFTIEEKRIKPKKRLLSDEEVVVKRVVKKKVTTVKPKGRSYKDYPTIINGRSPPK
ncbi:serine/threonine-protein kinase VRK1-like [Ostrinia furnacalis]|uniref:serine/threonine-protein kinase VRK1-like n=1 Tax=Ostrinia furnacalis TaxID=93504 RepID=UPI0010405BF8|nr:serine/threonine-protein kinase VRK1-like [Ostrinia furnacalis]XP_028171804.1 serine/threonine-protein kinase VRK1-like [Ostrinia furnacalis]XP_028171805.1 serine/threonine-protein kinase VRK1-like [Ostrinia furnacalis]